MVVLVVQVGGVDGAFAAVGQVAELAFQHHAALGHVARVQRGVVVRRQVEVVRGDQGEAGVAGAAEARRQEAGLAAVVDREIDVRGVEHREIFDPEGRVGRGAEAGGRVQLDVVALQGPGVAARFAAGVGAILEHDDGVLAALGVERAAAGMGLVDHVLGVVDLGLAVVQLDLGVVTDHQHALVAQLDVADQFAAVFQLMQVGLVAFHLHASLAQDHVTGEGGDLFFLLVARSLGGYVGRALVAGRAVIHARTHRLDVGAAAIGADFRQLGGGQFFPRNPVEVRVVRTAGLQRATAGLGDQALGRLCLDGFASAAGYTGARRGGADRGRGMRRARWQVGIGVLQRGAIPAAGGRYLAVELIGGLYSQCCDRLQSQQAAGDQQGKLSSKHEGFHCHLVNPGFLRAIGPVGRTPLDGLKKMLDNKA